MRLWSYEALAHGSDGMMFFQWRQSQGGAEKFHSAIVPHGDPHTSRTFRECAALGNELKQLNGIVGSRFVADIAIVFDWENWWALELDAKPNANIRYIHQMRALYAALRALNIAVDFIHPSESLDGYPLVIAYNLYSASEEFGNKSQRICSKWWNIPDKFLQRNRQRKRSSLSWRLSRTFKEVLGIIVEEFQPLKPEIQQQVHFKNKFYENRQWEEVIHLQGATPLPTFTSDFLKDSPAITKHRFGKGLAYYLGTELDQERVDRLIERHF